MAAKILSFPSTNDRQPRAYDGAPATVIAFPAEKTWRQALRDRRIAGAYARLANSANENLRAFCERAPADFFLSYYACLSPEARAEIDAA